MLTYKALLDDATHRLFECSDTPRIDSEVLMQHVLQKNIAWLIAYGDSVATADHVNAFYQTIEKREIGQPIAYITGSKDFWSLSLKVDKNVLIPRPDTETLVEQCIERLAKEQQVDVLDLGTGSGAIALSIAKERPFSNVTALEKHAAALEIARKNSRLNNVENVDFRLSDWFGAIDKSERFDLIASNPPYVEPGDPHLKRGDLRFEPITALTASESGLADIRIIVESAPKYLKDNGWLIIEHGYNQATPVAELFEQNGFINIELFNDINKLPRCTAGKMVAQ